MSISNKNSDKDTSKKKKGTFTEQKESDSNKAGKPDKSLRAKEEKESIKNSK